MFADLDEPPRSDAGQDLVVQLPTDWAVLDGRDSTDDHGIAHYQWTLVKGDSSVRMKVNHNMSGHIIASFSPGVIIKCEGVRGKKPIQINSPRTRDHINCAVTY